MAVKYGDLPFPEAIEHWDDIAGQAHDQYFTVAGATKADLLKDLHEAVRKGIAEGATLAEFRKDFDKAVAKHGWEDFTGSDTPGGIAWRTEVIYGTNLRTAYAAGRYDQMRAVAKDRPYLRYHHNDTVLTPRPEHLAWDGLILAADDPWWQTHLPPNGWGCRCWVESLAERDLQREGRDGPDQAPPSPIDPKTGAPVGIDRGWDHTPGATRDLAAELAEKAQRYPEPIRQALEADLDRLASGGARMDPPLSGPGPGQVTAPRVVGPEIRDRLVAKLARDARQWVLGQGRVKQVEHLLAYDRRDGRELGRAVGPTGEEVAIPAAVTSAAADPKAQIVIHHNHPDSLPLSPHDLSRLAQYPGLAEVVAHGHDGSAFAATRPGGAVDRDLIQAATDGLIKPLRDAAIRGVVFAGLEQHLVALALHSAGVIRYSYRLDAARAAVLRAQAQEAQTIVDAIVAAIGRTQRP